ncbi:MAG: ATP-binding protein [Candidatus Moranbacteria bacterium]|jgi:predicted HTH transcriptional regulator|nr:ATP-binding protein [Candidatus Moranbacteria bacterium]
MKELLKKIIIQNEDFDSSKKSKEENILENSAKENYVYKKIISQGENNFVEFKSSLRWDYEKNNTNRILEYVVAKTMCAFLNADGGKLIIGVDDSGAALGLEKDYQTLHKKNKDGFLLQLTQIINQYLGKEFYHYIDWRIIEIDGADICIVEILPSDIPAYLNNENNNEFFVRKSSSSQPLNMRQVAEYIKLHWSNI